MQKIYADYYVKKGRGFSESEFKKELASFIGENMDSFYSKYINGTEIPDYNEQFTPLGLKVNYVGKAIPSVGITMSNSGGRLIVKGIRSNSAAEDAGISVNDEIIGCNGFRVEKNAFDAFINGSVTGDVLSVLYSRDNQLYSTDIEVKNYESPRFDFTIIDGEYTPFWLRKL